MRLVNVADIEKAEYLCSLGFKYIKTTIGDKEVFQFIEDECLLKELNSKYGESSYFYSKYMNF